MVDTRGAGSAEAAAELASVATGLCQDARIAIEVGEGWFWDPLRRVISVSTKDLGERGPSYCAGIIAHEVGHFFISRYTAFSIEFPSVAAGRSLLNAIEDPRVDRWITARYPGARAWQEWGKVNELVLPNGGRGLPSFVRFCLECAAEGDRNFRPSTQSMEPEIVEALAATRDARARYAVLVPPTDLNADVNAEVLSRYREEVWPLLSEVRWTPARREQLVQVTALDALRLAEREIFPAAIPLYASDRRRVAQWLAQRPENATAGRRALDEGHQFEVVVRALSDRSTGQSGLPAHWSDELAGQLLDAAIQGRVRAPMSDGAGPQRDGGRPASGERRRGVGPSATDLLNALPRPATDYDRAYAEVAAQIEQLVEQLERILRPQKRLRASGGHPSGRRVDLKKLMAFEADPRRYNELWIRTTIPDRREAAVGLLVDLSGSMYGENIRHATLGTVLMAETLHRLDVPFAIYGFQDHLIPLHEFNEPMTTVTRQKISEMVQEVEGSRQGGNNNPGYNDDGPCLMEFADKVLEHPCSDRILIVVSDGEPAGMRSSEEDLKQAVARLTAPEMRLRLIGLGLGPETAHVRSYYPESMANVPPERFAETIGELVERVLLHTPN